MTAWARAREDLMRPTWAGTLGRQVALRLVDAMRRALAGHRRVAVLGPWPRVFESLGLPCPSGKAARAALGLLARVTSAVVRVTAQTWRVVSSSAEMPTAEQLELAWDRDRKAESADRRSTPAPRQRLRSRRARARALALERAWTPRPEAPPAAALYDWASQAEAEGQAWAVTLTAPDGINVEGAARALVDGAEFEIVLVPERSPRGRLHYHGVAIADSAVAVTSAWQRLVTGGVAKVEQIRRPARLRYWAGYATKGPDPDHEVLISTGVDPHEVEEHHGEEEPRPSLLGRAAARVRQLLGRWRR